MAWIFTIGVFAAFYWMARRAREQAAEHVATGMLRSPLYWSATTLTMALLGIVLYMAHLGHEGPISWLYYPLVGIMTVAVLLLRRALKWRYPI